MTRFIALTRMERMWWKVKEREDEPDEYEEREILINVDVVLHAAPSRIQGRDVTTLYVRYQQDGVYEELTVAEPYREVRDLLLNESWIE